MDQLTIEALYDRLFECAAKLIAEGEEHHPMLVTLHTSGNVGFVDCEGAPNPQSVYALMRLLVAEPNFVAVVMIHETWTLERTQLSPEEQARCANEGIADHPDRMEGVMFNVLTPTRQAMAVCPIERPANVLTKVPLRWLDELKKEEGEVVTGRMVRKGAPPCH